MSYVGFLRSRDDPRNTWRNLRLELDNSNQWYLSYERMAMEPVRWKISDAVAQEMLKEVDRGKP